MAEFGSPSVFLRVFWLCFISPHRRQPARWTSILLPSTSAPVLRLLAWLDLAPVSAPSSARSSSATPGIHLSSNSSSPTPSWDSPFPRPWVSSVSWWRFCSSSPFRKKNNNIINNNNRRVSTTTTLRWIHNSSKYFVTLDCSFEKVWLTNNNRGFIYTYIQSPSSVSGLGSGTTITLKLLYDIDTLPSTTYRSMIVHPLIISLEIGPIVPKNHQLGLLKTRERFDFTQNVKTKIIEGCRRGGE